MVETNGNGNGKTLKQKLSEPMLNAKQIFAVCMTILYEVISNLIPLAFGVEIAWGFILLNIIIGVIVIVFIALLRAAYPLEVPDKTIWSAFWLLWKQVVDLVTDPTSDPDTQMNVLEKSIQWDVREWDIAYQKKLEQQIQYYTEKQDAKIQALEKKNLMVNNTTTNSEIYYPDETTNNTT